MIKLGQTTRGTNHGCKYLWLVKNMQVFRNYDKKACYEVLAFNRGGWFVLYSGTLVDCIKFIGDEEIVESLEEDVKKETEKHYDDYTNVMEVKQDLNTRCGKKDNTIFAYNNAVAYNGDNVYSNELGAIAYQCKNYGNANVYKLEVESIEWKNRK